MFPYTFTFSNYKKEITYYQIVPTLTPLTVTTVYNQTKKLRDNANVGVILSLKIYNSTPC